MLPQLSITSVKSVELSRSRKETMQGIDNNFKSSIDANCDDGGVHVVFRELECKEEEPDKFPPVEGIYSIGLFFERSEWAAFKAYIDAILSDLE